MRRQKKATYNGVPAEDRGIARHQPQGKNHGSSAEVQLAAAVRIRTRVSGPWITPEGVSLFLARPFQIKDQACLSCHTTPEMAPAAMVTRYGRDKGFGWQLNEVIGARMVSVPISLPIQNANRAFQTFMASLGGVFAALFIILNLMLYILIVRPVRRVVAAADRLSIGRTSSPDTENPELPEAGKDGLAVPGRSFHP